MRFEFAHDEWRLFTKTEQKIIVLIREYGIEDHDRIRMLLGFPLEPIEKRTYQNHWQRVQKKIAQIRAARFQKVE